MRPLAPHPSIFGQPPGKCFLYQVSLYIIFVTSHLICLFYTGGLLMPPQGYGPLHWGMQLPHQGNPFFGGTFPGALVPPPSAASGSHNQFVPLQARTFKSLSMVFKSFFLSARVWVAHWSINNMIPCLQVTKKRVSGRTKYQDAKQFSSFQAQSSGPSQPASSSPSASKTPPPGTDKPTEKPIATTPKTPRQSANPHTPGSASKRKHRKLAVNFEAAKVTDWNDCDWLTVLLCCPSLFSSLNDYS